MATIPTGTTPLALPGGMGSVAAQAKPETPLYPSTLGKQKLPTPLKFLRKAPKQKKRAFGPAAIGAAFKK